MWRGLVTWSDWWLVPPVILLAVAALISRPRVQVPHSALGPTLLVLQFAAFFVAYVMTPRSVAWHVGTSWPRLIAQMWPIMVLTAMVRHGGAHGRAHESAHGGAHEGADGGA